MIEKQIFDSCVISKKDLRRYEIAMIVILGAQYKVYYETQITAVSAKIVNEGSRFEWISGLDALHRFPDSAGDYVKTLLETLECRDVSSTREELRGILDRRQSSAETRYKSGKRRRKQRFEKRRRLAANAGPSSSEDNLGFYGIPGYISSDDTSGDDCTRISEVGSESTESKQERISVITV